MESGGKITLSVCSTNLTSEEKCKLKKYISVNSAIQYKEHLCLSNCGTCSYHKFVKVQGQIYRAKSLHQLLDIVGEGARHLTY